MVFRGSLGGFCSPFQPFRDKSNGLNLLFHLAFAESQPEGAIHVTECYALCACDVTLVIADKANQIFHNLRKIPDDFVFHAHENSILEFSEN